MGVDAQASSVFLCEQIIMQRHNLCNINRVSSFESQFESAFTVLHKYRRHSIVMVRVDDS